MRGEHRRTGFFNPCSGRIIPACAGSTRMPSNFDGSRTGSSPHARGARKEPSFGIGLLRDHPRMRGEHRVRRAHGLTQDGIIPACAGSTSPLSMNECSLVGSSPHARGAHLRLGCLRGNPGIIPACAGSTSRRSPWLAWTPGSSPHARGAHRRRGTNRPFRRDHPRMRGEHHERTDVYVHDSGIIPACAGSTSDTAIVTVREMGSSPHARGAPNSRTCRIL